MAKKATMKKRIRRTPDQIIADLEAEIRRVKARQAAKEAKAVPEGKALLTAVKAIDKVLEEAREAQNEKMVMALEAGRAPLATHVVEMGGRLPKRRQRRTAEQCDGRGGGVGRISRTDGHEGLALPRFRCTP